MLRPLMIAAVLVGLSACASAPRYAPATVEGGMGYSERQIETGRYFVTYRAGGDADAALLQDYALLRAAELTLQAGREWFWVDRLSIEPSGHGGGGPSIGVGVGGGTWGGRGGGGVGVGINVPVGAGGPARARAAILEIRFGQGPKPDEANAYDARAISANVRARLMQ